MGDFRPNFIIIFNNTIFKHHFHVCVKHNCTIIFQRFRQSKAYTSSARIYGGHAREGYYLETEVNHSALDGKPWALPVVVVRSNDSEILFCTLNASWLTSAWQRICRLFPVNSKFFTATSFLKVQYAFDLSYITNEIFNITKF